MFSPEQLQQFQNIIAQYNTFGISVHSDPDGDAIGSALGLWERIKWQWKNIFYYTPTPISCLFDFLPEVKYFSQEVTKEALLHIECWISVDTATRARSILEKVYTEKPILHIDHHPSHDTGRWTINLINDAASSCAEIITFLIQNSSPLASITPTIANHLLMGISTDTGHFQWWKNLSSTFHTASILLTQWANIPYLVNTLYRNNDFDGLKYVGLLLQSIQKEDNIIRCLVDTKELEKHNLDQSKIEVLLHLMTSITHDGIFILFKSYSDAEKPYLKGSLRTKNPNINLTTIAEEFWGGGHRAAAAFRIFLEETSINETIQNVLTTIRQKA